MNKKLSLILLATLLVSCGQSAAVSAATSSTVYFAPTDTFKGKGDTLKLNVNRKGDGEAWQTVEMTKTEDTYHGRTIYSATFENLYGGAGKMQFQIYDGSTWKAQAEPISSWTADSNFEGKLLPKEDFGETPFIDYTADADLVAGSALYLDTKNWDVENVDQRYAAFFYDGLGSTWVDMVEESSHIYKVIVPEGYTTVIFCRMKGSDPVNNWDNKWNKTGNLYSGSIDNNLYIVNDMDGNGSWKKYTAIDDIFGMVDNNYTRTTTINFTSQGYDDAVSVNKYKDGFSQTRVTTWIDGALYMTNNSTVNSGYFTSKEDGHMHHFKFGGESYSVSSADNVVIDDGYAAEAGVNEFFANNDNNACSMHYLNENKATLKSKFKFDTNKASADTVTYYSNDADIVNRFLAICAPCYLNTPVEQGKDSFVILTTAMVVLNADNTIELALYCDVSDSYSTSKLNDGSNKFAWAIISNIGTSTIPSIMSFIGDAE